MSQQLQIGENTGPIPEVELVVGEHVHAGSHPVQSALKIVATLLLIPLLLVIALGGFLVVLADFTWFRLKEIRYGNPEPKGLWEF